MRIVNGKGTGYEEFFMQDVTGNVMMGTSMMEPHTEGDWGVHEGDEYSLVLSGEMICCTEDGEEYHVQKGDAIMTPAGQRHRSDCISDEESRVVWFEVAK